MQVSDRELDPIQRLVKEERKEIKGIEVKKLSPNDAGQVSIKEGYGEPIGSGRKR